MVRICRLPLLGATGEFTVITVGGVAVTNVNGIGEGTEVTSAGKVGKVRIMDDGGSTPIPMLCN